LRRGHDLQPQSDVVADDQRAPDAGAESESELDAVGSAERDAQRFSDPVAQLESYCLALLRTDRRTFESTDDTAVELSDRDAFRGSEPESHSPAVAESVERPERRAERVSELSAFGESFCESLERAVGRAVDEPHGVALGSAELSSVPVAQRDAQRGSDRIA
jgi:hypothetical protein